MNYGIKDNHNFVTNPPGASKRSRLGEFNSYDTGWGGFANKNPVVTTGSGVPSSQGQIQPTVQTKSMQGTTGQKMQGKVLR